MLLLLFYLVDQLTHRSALITPIDERARLLALFLGFTVGAAIAWSIISRMHDQLGARDLFGMLCTPLLTAFLMYQMAIKFGETLDFAMVQPTRRELNAPIVGTRPSFGKLYANVQPFDGARGIRVPIDRRFDSAMRASGSNSGCIRLVIEEGRRKSLRAIVPNIFDRPLGADRLVSCD